MAVLKDRSDHFGFWCGKSRRRRSVLRFPSFAFLLARRVLGRSIGSEEREEPPFKRTCRPTSWRGSVTRYQWLVLFVAWLGWVFDSMDATIYALVMHPALHDLLRVSGSQPVGADSIGWYGGIIFSIFLVGWAIGGVLFGVIADNVGRTKTLILTILIYAVFTGMAALSRTWWELALFRFLTALGIGGEWAAGAALVAEVWPEGMRAKAAGLLQSAWAAGFLTAAIIVLLLRDHSGLSRR